MNPYKYYLRLQLGIPITKVFFLFNIIPVLFLTLLYTMMVLVKDVPPFEMILLIGSVPLVFSSLMLAIGAAGCLVSRLSEPLLVTGHDRDRVFDAATLSPLWFPILSLLINSLLIAILFSSVGGYNSRLLLQWTLIRSLELATVFFFTLLLLLLFSENALATLVSAGVIYLIVSQELIRGLDEPWRLFLLRLPGIFIPNFWIEKATSPLTMNQLFQYCLGDLAWILFCATASLFLYRRFDDPARSQRYDRVVGL